MSDRCSVSRPVPLAPALLLALGSTMLGCSTRTNGGDARLEVAADSAVDGSRHEAAADRGHAAPDALLDVRGATDVAHGPPSTDLSDQGPSTGCRLSFPKDESPHATAAETYRYVAVLISAVGDVYGMHFSVRTVTDAKQTTQIASFALADMQSQSFSQAQVTKVGAPSSSAPGFKFVFGDWIAFGHAGKDSLMASLSNAKLNISLLAESDALCMYGSGFFPSAAAMAPLAHYAYAQMDIEGTVSVDVWDDAVIGTAWMDHRWGDAALEARHDQISIRFEDGTDLALFGDRRGTATVWYGSVRDPGQAVQALAPADLQVSTTGTWQSPKTQKVYPHGWQVRIPPLQLAVTITPRVDDQELYDPKTAVPAVWDGLCTAVGSRAAKTVSGPAAVELAGY